MLAINLRKTTHLYLFFPSLRLNVLGTSRLLPAEQPLLLFPLPVEVEEEGLPRGSTLCKLLYSSTLTKFHAGCPMARRGQANFS